VFTGIVEELGRVERAPRGPGGGRLVVAASLGGTAPGVGESVAVNGVCLTVVESGQGFFSADVSTETLRRTTLGELERGELVNLERPLRLSDRLGGHLVQGHVDAVGVVRRAAPDLVVAVEPRLTRYLVEKGSVAVDGCSLTVVEVLADGFRVAVIPHTAAVTTLGRRRPGEHVNVEVDVLAKYVEGLLRGGVERGLEGGARAEDGRSRGQGGP
jgi:riboflavin synthase